MDTLKTGFVVMLLLAVLYGVYTVLNKDQSPPTAEIAWHEQEAAKDLQIEFDPAAGTSTPASTAFTSAGETSLPVPPFAGTTGSPEPVASPGNTSTLGIPAVVKAELSASEPVTPPSSSASFPSTTESPSPVPPPLGGKTSLSEAAPGDPTAESSFPPANVPSVSAPGLLSAAEAAASAAGSAEPTKPASMPSLPSLRESPDTTAASTSVPQATAAAEPQVPAAESPVDPMPTAATADAATVPASLDKTEGPSGDAPADAAAPSAYAVQEGPKAVSTSVLLEASMREAHTNIGEEKWYQALFVLSKFYGSSDLTSEQEQELVDLLDPLAAKVVYSQEHLVTDPHEVQRGETLAQIAEKYQVPTELLANINGIENTNVLVPGTRLKIVRGPFRADVCLSKQELTLFAGQLYAGRFPITLGRNPEPAPGEYRVLEKQPGKDYFGDSGQSIPADDPRNPYGRVWMGLGKGLAIHGSADSGDQAGEGCISLSPLDAYDVSCILSAGSAVTVRP